MNKKFKGIVLLLLICMGLFLLAACQSEDANAPVDQENSDGGNNTENVQTEDPADEEEPNVKESTKPWAYSGEPTTVRMLINVGEEDFEKRYKSIVEEEFDNITLELIRGNPTDLNFLQELFADDVIPDIITVNPNHELVIEMDALEPIDDYIERSGFDLGIFRENIIDNLRARDPAGENRLFGLPIESMLIVMYYNKEIFDMFGEPYPTDDMTWTEALDVARKLTTVRDGVQYKGIQLSRTNAIPYTQLGIPGVDPETEEILFVDHPDTKRHFELLNEIRNIPGMMEPNENDGFHTGDRNIAMWINTAQFLPILAQVEGFDFDMVTTPMWEHKPNIAPTSVALSFNVMKYSENKDAAFSVIAFLASEEAQIHLSRVGSVPTINSTEAYEQFGAEVLEQYGREYNIQAAFRHPMGKMPPHSRYSPDVTFFDWDFISRKSLEFLNSDKDVNTFIREMGEEYETIMKEMKGQE